MYGLLDMRGFPWFCEYKTGRKRRVAQCCERSTIEPERRHSPGPETGAACDSRRVSRREDAILTINENDSQYESESQSERRESRRETRSDLPGGL
jgi:hypothetical protein